MVVTLTSQVLGQEVGSTYTGQLEDWLLASGYAKRASYTGVGVSNTGAAAAPLSKDPREPENREAPHWPEGESEDDLNWSIANDADNLTEAKFPNPDYDFDEAGVDNDAPSGLTFTPSGLPLAGGVVKVEGDNLEGVTAATVGGTAVTGLNVTKAADGEITFTAPAKTAGSYPVVLTDASGNATVNNALTYAA